MAEQLVPRGRRALRAAGEDGGWGFSLAPVRALRARV